MDASKSHFMSHLESSPPSTFRVFLRLELRETLLARWYQLYGAGFAGLLGLFFAFGLSESQIMGFQGLGRTLLTFLQVSLVILPLFVLITTARTLVSDRESGVWEYMLSFPLSLNGYYWGRFCGRGLAIAFPLVLALLVGGSIEQGRSGEAPWTIILAFSSVTVALTICFLGVGMLISMVSGTQESALGAAFGVWLLAEAIVDALLLGLMIEQRVAAELVMGLAMLNPLQAFRTASISLFEPELSLLGPLSYTLLDELGRLGLFAWALAWPTLLGLACALMGFSVFRRADIV